MTKEVFLIKDVDVQLLQVPDEVDEVAYFEGLGLGSVYKQQLTVLDYPAGEGRRTYLAYSPLVEETLTLPLNALLRELAQRRHRMQQLTEEVATLRAEEDRLRQLLQDSTLENFYLSRAWWRRLFTRRPDRATVAPTAEDGD